MKTVLLMRHAKSSWSDGGLDDHDRPLNKRGRSAAPKLGRLLLEADLTPDLVMPSTARRARETAELVAQAADYEGELVPTEDLYLAAPSVYMEEIARLAEQVTLPLLIGHNPGIGELVGWLTGQEVAMPTAALAVVDLEGDCWVDAAQGHTGSLRDYWIPRELD
jgi:phosphohistidine phosphatase